METQRGFSQILIDGLAQKKQKKKQYFPEKKKFPNFPEKETTLMREKLKPKNKKVEKILEFFFTFLLVI